MPIKNPSHSGGCVLRQCIEPLGMSIADAAALGVTRTTSSELVNERTKSAAYRRKWPLRLSRAFGRSAASWLIQQA